MKIIVELKIVREYSPNQCTWHLLAGEDNSRCLFRVVEIFSATTGIEMGYTTPLTYPGRPIFFLSLEEVETLMLQVLTGGGGVDILQSSPGVAEHDMFRALVNLEKAWGKD